MTFRGDDLTTPATPRFVTRDYKIGFLYRRAHLRPELFFIRLWR